MSIYVAWLDESGSNQAIDLGTYILSAVIGEAQHAADMCNTMRALLAGKGHKKLHWRDEDAARQELIAKTIASLGVERLVVVRSDAHTSDRPERQCRLCRKGCCPS